MKIIHNNLSKSSVVLIFASIPPDKFIILLPNALAIIPGKQLIFPIIYLLLAKYFIVKSSSSSLVIPTSLSLICILTFYLLLRYLPQYQHNQIILEYIFYHYFVFCYNRNGLILLLRLYHEYPFAKFIT